MSQYIPDPLRCYRCQKYGHTAKNCSSKEKCPICSKDHSYKDCPIKDSHREGNKAVCSNCNGAHPASFQGCGKYKEAKQIKKIQTIEGISYSAAVKRRQHTEKIEQVPKKLQVINVQTQLLNRTTNQTNTHSEKSTQHETPIEKSLTPSAECYVDTQPQSKVTRQQGTQTENPLLPSGENKIWPPSEPEDTSSSAGILHNDCVKKDIFHAFLKNSANIFTDPSKNNEERIKCYLTLIKEITGIMKSHE